MITSPWHLEIFIGLAISTAFISYWLKQHTSILFALLFGYIMIFSAYIDLLPVDMFPNYGLVTIFQIKDCASGAGFWLRSLILPFILFWHYISQKVVKNLTLFFIGLGLINSLFVLKWLIPGFDGKGIQLNEAQDGALIACLLPLCFSLRKRYRWPLIAIFAAAIIVSKSSTAYFGLAVAIGSYIFCKYRRMFEATLFSCVVLLLSYYSLGKDFLDGNGRYGVWKISMEFFSKQINHLIGTGPGTFFIYGPQIQLARWGNSTPQVFVWMHNEWLQILFELGIIGLVLSILVYISVLLRLRDRPIYFASLVTYGLTALTQMPAHQLASAYFGVFLVVVAFRRPLS